MFGFEYYPTPSEGIELLIEGLVIEGKVCYDPSAGGGHIVKRLHDGGASQVLATELDADLREILKRRPCTLLGDDFLKVQSHEISHVDVIVMNPPFSNGVEHILHAFKVAPPGCNIRALCNAETIKNPYSKSREELKALVDAYGQHHNVGNIFSTAERKTDVEVSLLHLDKPGQTNSEFDGFFMDEDVEEKTGAGLMPYNVVRDLVNRYVRAVQIYDQQIETAVQLSEMTRGFYGGSLGMQVTRDGAPLARNEFKKGMQKAGWDFIFHKLDMAKHSTRKLKEDINKFVEKQQHIPFTMRNIYRMLEIVIGTQGARMDSAILDVFDKVTGYHDDNRAGVPGWKTNSHYLLTRRFIMPNLTRQDNGMRPAYGNDNFGMVEDLLKALCYITGEDFESKRTLYKFLDEPYYFVKNGEPVRDSKGQIVSESHEYQLKYRINSFPDSEIAYRNLVWGQWFDWEYFRIRAYKKGTIHFEFRDEKVWAAFNQRVAKLKGYPLPEKKAQTAYQDRQNGRRPERKTAAAWASGPPVKPVILGTFKIKSV